MDIDYVAINSLEEIASQASEAINASADKAQINFILSHCFPVDILKNSLRDVAEKAGLWASPECRDPLYFNHGQFIGDGLSHIIQELNRKPTSNRALTSLISQKHISNSDDKPIPSFMLMQTGINSNELFCTCYFRALEISSFLRINIEEIRLKLTEICASIRHIRTIKLVIFAFRAYISEGFIPLEKPELDFKYNEQLQILDLLRLDRPTLKRLLEEKARATTVIDLEPLKNLLKCLAVCETYGITVTDKPLLISRTEAAIKTGEALKKLRLTSSHDPHIRELTESFSALILDISKEICS